MHIAKKCKPFKSVYTSHPWFPVGEFLFPEATTAPGSCVFFLETFHACTSVCIYIIYIYIKNIQRAHTCI